MQTDFDKEVDKVKESLENAVNDMNMSDKSRKAALETMDAYIEAIKSKQAEAVSASEAVAYATANILNGKSQYATGYVPECRQTSMRKFSIMRTVPIMPQMRL